MFLMYYLDEKGERVYTFSKVDPNGRPTTSAHPAKFSPEDKYSRERILIKKRFGILPTQLPPLKGRDGSTGKFKSANGKKGSKKLSRINIKSALVILYASPFFILVGSVDQFINTPFIPAYHFKMDNEVRGSKLKKLEDFANETKKQF